MPFSRKPNFRVRCLLALMIIAVAFVLGNRLAAMACALIGWAILTSLWGPRRKLSHPGVVGAIIGVLSGAASSLHMLALGQFWNVSASDLAFFLGIGAWCGGYFGYLLGDAVFAIRVLRKENLFSLDVQLVGGQDSDQAQPDEPPWHRFTLRTLLLLMLVASIMMSWIGVNVRYPQRQAEDQAKQATEATQTGFVKTR